MRYSGRTERDDDEPWFRLGQLEVTTTVFVLLLWVATLVIFTVEPLDKPVTTGMALIPDDVTSGEVWRLVTWPWSHAGFSLWTIIDAVIFWFVGSQIERQIQRRSYTALVVWSIVIISFAATAWSAVIPGETVIADLRLLELTMLLLFCAEHPKMPFFFGIPAWAIAGIIVALEVVNDLAFREWIRLLTMIVAAFFIAIVARRLGLLADYDRIPDWSFPRRKKADGPTTQPEKRKASRGRPGGGAGGNAKKRPGPLWGKGREAEPAEIVQMPVRRPRAMPSSNEPEVSVDDLALDALLDKIADGGMEALTPAERTELDELRARRRGGPA